MEHQARPIEALISAHRVQNSVDGVPGSADRVPDSADRAQRSTIRSSTLGSPSSTLGLPSSTLDSPSFTLSEPIFTLGEPASRLSRPSVSPDRSPRRLGTSSRRLRASSVARGRSRVPAASSGAPPDRSFPGFPGSQGPPWEPCCGRSSVLPTRSAGSEGVRSGRFEKWGSQGGPGEAAKTSERRRMAPDRPGTSPGRSPADRRRRLRPPGCRHRHGGG